jgi:short-subunit dehydrogenase
MSRVTKRSLDARRVLITGGSSGIGLECARELTRRGSRVVLLSRGGSALLQAAASLEPSPATLSADVADVHATRTAVARAAGLLGGLDAVVANAGAGAYGPFAEMSPDDYRRTLEITLLGMINTAHAALPHLERTGGTLVVVGSVAGRVPTPWLSVYSAAKHGVRGFVRSLDAELRASSSSARISLVAPGPVDTPFWRHARTVDRRLPPELPGVYRPEDVAAEITRALVSARTERSVGGTMAAWALLDAVAPNVMVRMTGSLAKRGWRDRAARPPSPHDGLSEPARDNDVGGGLRSRPSLLVQLRELGRIGR